MLWRLGERKLELQGGTDGAVEWDCWRGGGGAARAAVGRRTYQESDTEGGAEGESRAEGRAVSQPKSACPAENVGEGGREGGSEYRGLVGVGPGGVGVVA
jgi:hypothetical protein